MYRILVLLFAAGLLLFAAGCSEDKSPTDTGDNDPPQSNVETVDNGDGSFTTTVNAGYLDATEWVYFSFSTMDEVTEPDRAPWDLALLFADIKLNGGTSGGGGMELVATDGGDYEAITQAPADGWITDSDPDLAFNTGDGWYTYDYVSHAFSINARYYCIKLSDGSYVKLEILDFVDDAGTPGYPQFHWQEITAP